ncbi:MAG: radical SAM family heme chaperone HemW [Trueperaceae bacterium]|nr:radical SAM family heme chaperone HemW [Trueperaceae bacterium]
MLRSVRHLYLHVPFCPSICPYCDFHKMLRHEGLVARYLDRLESEAAEVAARYGGARLDTVYLGGGTPSHLTDAELDRVFGLLRLHWGGAGAVETTLEADPLTFDAERLRLWRDLGIDRLSIGLQSTDDAVLSYLGRVHDAAGGLAAVAMALEAGFRVNVDVIAAVPGQDLESDLRTVIATGARHVSVYSLTIEPHTPFALRGVRVDPDQDADAFELAGELLAAAGLARYEVSNFAAPGEESRHNLAYWRGAHYLALGPSASAYLPEGGPFGTRAKSQPLKTWLLGAEPERDVLDLGGYVLERLLTGLRTSEGVDLAELESAAGTTLAESAPGWLAAMTAAGMLAVETEPPDRTLRATAAGLARLDAVMLAYVRAQR